MRTRAPAAALLAIAATEALAHPGHDTVPGISPTHHLHLTADLAVPLEWGIAGLITVAAAAGLTLLWRRPALRRRARSRGH